MTPLNNCRLVQNLNLSKKKKNFSKIKISFNLKEKGPNSNSKKSLTLILNDIDPMNLDLILYPNIISNSN